MSLTVDLSYLKVLFDDMVRAKLKLLVLVIALLEFVTREQS